MANSTEKRGQTMTLFLLLGVVLIAVVGFMLFLRGGMEGTDVEDAADLGLSTTSFKAHAHQCLRQEVLNAVDKYGVIDGQGPYIGAYVRKNLPKCIEWDFYEKQGFAITAGNPEVQVEIAPDTLLVDVEYPIEGGDERGAFSFEELYYYLPRGAKGQLVFDAAGKLEEEVSIPSPDGDAELIIPAGTVVTDVNGNPVDEVTVRVLERDFNGLDNPLIVGMVAYEVEPEVMFSQPVTLKVTYRQQDVPAGVNEENLRLAQFDEDTGLWLSVPTHVDPVKNSLTAQFTHFSPFAPVARCSEEEADRIEFPVSMLKTENLAQNFVFLQDCGDDALCAEVTWMERDEPALFEYPESFSQDPPGLTETKLLPVKDEENEGQFLTPEKAYNQVVLSHCTVKDWDLDDVVDSITEDKIEKTVKECSGFSPPDECVSEGKKEITVDACKQAITTFVESNAPYADLLAAYQAEEGTGDAIRDHERTPETAEEGEEIMPWCTCTITAENANTAESADDLTFSTDCKPVVATPPTYGYPPIDEGSVSDPWDLPGGFGVLRFRFAGTGGGCIALDEYNKPHIELTVETLSDTENAVSWKVNPYTGSLGEPEFLKLTPADSGTAKAADAWTNWGSYKGNPAEEDYELYSGGKFYNEIYIRVDDLNEDGCINAVVTDFAIYGVGIIYDVPAGAYEHCTVTVQDRVNYLCGCDGNCNTHQGQVEGEDDWSVDSELNILASWRGEWNPSAGSVVNGQTLLCDLDPNDPRLQELKSKGWTPYGGYCGPDGPVDMMPVVEGGQCEAVGVSACDYGAEHHTVMECEGSGNGTVWKATAECGEGQVCRIIGEAAQCTGQEIVPEGCKYYLPPYSGIEIGEQFGVFNGVCYECVGSSIQRDGAWELRSELKPDAEPPCSEEQTLLSQCVDEHDIERECMEPRVCDAAEKDGWQRAQDNTIREECAAVPYYASQGKTICCERVSREAGCNNIDSCTDYYTANLTPFTGVANYNELCQANPCVISGGCKLVGGSCVPTGTGCNEIDSCTDYETAALDPFTGVADNNKELCLADPCTISGGCELVGGSCVPTGTECLPDIPLEGLPPGTPEQKYWRGDGYWSDGKCYECVVVRAWAAADDYQWKKTKRGECACAPGVNVGDTAWSATDKGCRRCDGVDRWTPVDVSLGNCPDKMCFTFTQQGEEFFVAPGKAVCLGDTGGRMYRYAECHVDSEGEPQATTQACGMGCTVNERKTPGQFAAACACPGGACNTCFPTGFIQMFGREGEYVLAGSGACYVCHGQAGDNWDVSTGCTCTYIEYDERVDVAIGEYDWDKVNKVCRKCVADTSNPQTTPAYWEKRDVSITKCGASAKCFIHQSVSVPNGGIWYNELLCIAGSPNSRVQKCLGNDEWGVEERCDYGCKAGEKIPSKPPEWCDPESH